MAVPNKIMHSIVRLCISAPAEGIKARDGIPESEQIRRGLLLWFAQKGVKPKGKK